MNPRQKYLARYAEPEAALECPTDRGWQHVVAIPACKEADWLPHTLKSLAMVEATGVLAIVIVNGREGAGDETHTLNALTLEHLASRQDRVQLAPNIDLGRFETIDLMVIDRASKGHRLAPEQGVGTARKIVADVALSLIDRGAVSKPWIWNTDADVMLPRDYLDAAADAPAKTSALTLPFVHVPPEGASEATITASRLYDLRLRHYVDGLARAGSPWAFHTVGSTIVVHADHYARVRGFPKRNAAEDFYLLAKLAKTGTIHTPKTTPITLAGRASDRVPFGTGAAIGKLIETDDPGAEYTFYDPRSFTELGRWLRAMDAFVEAPEEKTFHGALDQNSALSPELRTLVVARLGLAKALQRAGTSSPRPDRRRKHLHDWFDAFKTLKFIHALRELVWPEVHWSKSGAQP